MFDLIIIGGGPAGYETAIHASLKGLKVALIEKEWIGGTCLHVGCIPTKTLYKQAEVLKTLEKASVFGIETENVKIDPVKMKAFSRSVIEELTAGIQFQLKAAKVEVFSGTAAFVDPNTVSVGEHQLTAKAVFIATGSRCAVPLIEGIDAKNVHTSRTLLSLTEIPKHLVVVGGGIIGLEFASIYRQLGSEVTLLEATDRMGMSLDQEVAKRLAFFMKKQGIQAYNNAFLKRIEESDDGLTLTLAHQETDKVIQASHVLLSTGRVANVSTLNLTDIGIDYSKHGIKVNEHFQTNFDHIYAIGDINGISMLAHSASFQGMHALHHLLGEESHIDFSLTPAAVFTFPEVASIGLTEDEAKHQGRSIRVLKSQYKGNGKAVSMHETDGFAKIIVQDNHIIGAHIIGYQASTLIHEFGVIMRAKMPIHTLKSMIHAHPTLSEVIQSVLMTM